MTGITRVVPDLAEPIRPATKDLSNGHLLVGIRRGLAFLDAHASEFNDVDMSFSVCVTDRAEFQVSSHDDNPDVQTRAAAVVRFADIVGTTPFRLGRFLKSGPIDCVITVFTDIGEHDWSVEDFR